MISETSLANLRPWTPGQAPDGNAARKSRHVERTLSMARKGCPKAMQLALDLIDDEEASMRYRLKAAEIVLEAGLPRDLDKALDTMFGGRTLMRVEFIRPGVTAEATPNGYGTFEVSFAPSD